MRTLPNLMIGQLPRMADFANWASACEEGLGMASGEFLKVYEANRVEARDLALGSSPLYESLLKLARTGFRGSTAELLDRLNAIALDGARRSARWPKAPNALGNSLRRMASNLRSAGIDIQFSRADRLGRNMVSVTEIVNPEKIVSGVSARR